MRNLRLVGLSEDGQQIIFVDDAGSEFAALADDRLRAALRGDRARLGQLEIEMDSALRPRDIQARIRAGESPEAVAAVAQVPVDQIMPFCVPVIAERQHIAHLAQRSHVRRKNVEGPSRQLSDVVVERLRDRGIDPEVIEWDSWRRGDGRWSVQTTYQSGERERSAMFVFDAIGRYSVADDDEAKWLTGERQSTSRGPQPREAGAGGERRLSAVPSDPGQPILSEDDEEIGDDLTAVVRAVREPGETGAEPADPIEVSDRLRRASRGADARETDDGSPSGPEASEAGYAEDVAASGDAPGPSPRRASRPGDEGAEPKTEPAPDRKRRQRRASVPTWDEIMFGKDKDE